MSESLILTYSFKISKDNFWNYGALKAYENANADFMCTILA